MPADPFHSSSTDEKKEPLVLSSQLESKPPPSYSSALSATAPEPPPQIIYPQQAHHRSAPSQTLHIYFDGLSARRLYVLASDKTTLLYTIENNVRSNPSMTFLADASNSDGVAIGTVNIRAMASKIPCMLHNGTITLEPRGFFKSGHQYTSAAFEGKMTWKSEGKISANMILADEKGVMRARFENRGWSVEKSGVLEIYDIRRGNGEGGSGDQRRDEIVLTGLAVVESRRRKNAQGASVAVAPAGAAGGGAV